MRPVPSVAALALCSFLLATAVLSSCSDDAQVPGPVETVAAQPGIGFAYVDVAESLGYTLHNRTGTPRQKNLILEAMAPGIAVGDFNGDGWMDMYCPNGNRVTGYDTKRKRPILLTGNDAPRNALYWNREGKRLE